MGHVILSAGRPVPGALVLVLDAGSSSGRAALLDADGAIVHVASRPWQLPMAADGSQDLPAEAMAQALDDAIREVIPGRDPSGASGVVAVTATSIRGALVVLDTNGTVLWACGSSDARAAAEIHRMLPQEPAFHRSTGQKVVLAAEPRLRWLDAQRPEVAARAAHVLPLDAWLLRRLADSDIAAATSTAATTGLVDLATRRVDPGTERDPIGHWRRRFPTVAEAGSRVGSLSKAAADRLGVPVGIPLVAGGGDAQLASLGMGRVDPGDAATIMGTHWQQTVTLDHPWTDPDRRVRTIPHAPSDRWQVDAIAWSAGRLLDWAVELVGGDRAGVPGPEREAAFRWLEADAERSAPGAGGVIAAAGLPMTSSTWSHAAPTLTGFHLDDGRAARGAIFRAVVEAGCLAAATNLRAIAEAGAPGASVASPIRVGGGAARSDLVCQVLADVTGRVVERAATAESSILGGAICAWTGVARFPGVIDGAGAFARVERRFRPAPPAVAAYREVARRWAAVADAARALAEDGITEPVWRPVP